ncbi:MAG: bacteriohemerythrin [Sulfurisoma sp.]|nr:bacteriohemerythrin [Sulfurisoma sp.]
MSASKDTLVAWQDDFGLGLTEIDDQHKSLFDLINRLWAAVVGRADTAEMMAILAELEHYTLSHFAAEETFMRVIDYPGFAEHKKAHEAFVGRLGEEKKSILAGKHFSLEMLRFLKDWLINHIMVMDRAYAEVHAASKQPKSMFSRLFQRFF